MNTLNIYDTHISDAHICSVYFAYTNLEVVHIGHNIPHLEKTSKSDMGRTLFAQ